MKTDASRHHIVDLTRERRAWLNLLHLSRPTLRMYGLVEVDVTIARRFIAAHKSRTGEALSFTGYLVYCLARAVDGNREVQAYLKGRRRLVVFDDVNVGLWIERKFGEDVGLIGHVIQEANRKNFREIHEEIRSVQTGPRTPIQDQPGWFMNALLLPWPLSALFRTLLGMATRRDPTLLVSISGTVGVAAVGMFGKGHSGWGMISGRHSLDLVVGSTVMKPSVVEGRVEPREILNLTLVFDHDVIDGAPAARFTRTLVELIESGHGLSTTVGPGSEVNG